jgi:hypothetical protein
MKTRVMIAVLFAASAFCVPAAAKPPAGADWLSPGKVMTLSFKDAGWIAIPRSPPYEFGVLDIVPADKGPIACSVDETLGPLDLVDGADFSPAFWQSQHALGVETDSTGSSLVTENSLLDAGGVGVHRLVDESMAPTQPVLRFLQLTFVTRTKEHGVIGVIYCKAPPARWGEVENIVSSLRIFGKELKAAE